MRAFVAVLPPDEVVEQLTDFLQPRRVALAARGQWRWTRPEHLHLTLAFLPEVEGWREETLVEEGVPWAARTAPLPVRLAGAGSFPDPGAARVLWAGVEELAQEQRPGGASSLAGWSATLRGIANHAGIQVAGTRFRAHVTLGRARGGPHPAGHLLQALDTLATDWWTVDEVHLVRSLLGQGPGGTPRYEVAHTWSLEG